MKNRFLILLFLWTKNPIPELLKAQVWDSLGADLRNNSLYNHGYAGKILVGINDTVGNLHLSNVGIWDGGIWDTLGAGISGGITTSAEFNGNLYLGGQFKYVGGASFPDPRADNLTYWDGNQYHLTDYRNYGAIVRTLAVYNNDLYLGASQPFEINGITYSAIARYNGTTWSDVGGGVFSTFREVLCMTKFNGELIVAGRFDFAGTTQASNIARWDGTQWYPMGDGLSYYVRALYVDTISNELYAGGSFTQSGPTQLNFIAKWDGNAWQPLGSGLGNFVQSITKYKGQLYAGTSHYLNPSPIMRFDGNSWTPVIPAPNKLTYCLNVYQDALYASGSFDSIGGVPYAGIARYRDTITSVQQNVVNEKLFELFPNPTKDKLEIKFIAQISETFQITISDVSGKTVLKNEYSNNPSNIVINLPEKLKSGIYYCQIRFGERQYSESFVIQK